MSTQVTKQYLYRKGLFLMPPPPVNTFAWRESDWIKFIDLEGVWAKGANGKDFDIVETDEEERS